MVPHIAFPKCITTATKATMNTTTRVHVTKAVIGTCQIQAEIFTECTREQ